MTTDNLNKLFMTFPKHFYSVTETSISSKECESDLKVLGKLLYILEKLMSSFKLSSTLTPQASMSDMDKDAIQLFSADQHTRDNQFKKKKSSFFF